MNSANVSLSTLTAMNEILNQSGAAYSRISQSVNIAKGNYFRQFDECLTLIRNKVVKAGERLEHARRVLRQKQSQWVRITNPDGTTSLRPADCTVELRIVEMAQQHYDSCRKSLSEAERIIESCNTHGSLVKGTYNILEREIKNASAKISEIIETVVDYNNSTISAAIPQSLSASMMPQDSGTDDKEPENQNGNQIVLTFLDSGNIPLNANIQIVDNALFGFQTINMHTGKDGRIRLSNVKTSDCTIYINGRIAYNGPLTGNLEFTPDK